MRPRLRALVTAGGTVEPIDDVRAVTNHSTGRFGAAIARALAWRGVDVTVLGSRRMLSHADWLPPTVRTVPYGSFQELRAALAAELEDAPDLVLMASAVADYSPVPEAGKIRSDMDELTLTMRRNPKLLASLRDQVGRRTRLVGFKLLSGVSRDELVDVARRQLASNRLDLTVANDLTELTPTEHPILMVTPDAVRRVEGDRELVAESLAEASLELLDTSEAEPMDEPAVPWRPASGPVWGRARRWVRVRHATLDHLPAPPHELLDDHDAACAVLAPRRAPPSRPVLVPVDVELSGVDLLVGLADADLRELRFGWAAAASTARRLAPRARLRTAWYDRTLAAVIAESDPPLLVETGLADPDAWPQAVLPHHLPAPAVVAVPAADWEPWITRGFSFEDDRGDVVWLRPPHVRRDVKPAVSAALVDVRRREVLLGRRLTSPARGGLAFPGGRLERGEEAEDAARRELREETGVRAPGAPPWFVRRVWRGADPTWRIDCHVWRVYDRGHPAPTDELDARWWSIAEALDHPDTLPGVRAVLRALRDRIDP